MSNAMSTDITNDPTALGEPATTPRGPVTSASYSITVRLTADGDPASSGRIATAVGSAGGAVTAIDVVDSRPDGLTVDGTCSAADAVHSEEMVQALRDVPGVRVRKVSDRTFLLHLGGKLEVASRVPLKTRDDLSMAYTPGVARVCLALAAHPEDVRRLTIKGNTVAVVTDGSAVRGLGDTGPGAAGTAIVSLLLEAGVGSVLVWDREGILSPDDERLSGAKLELARRTNPGGERGELPQALQGADVFIGVSAGNVLPVEALAGMN